MMQALAPSCTNQAAIRAITPDTALRLSGAFDTTPDFWLNLQKNFDLWQAENGSQDWKKVKPFPKSMRHGHASTHDGKPGA
jgi:plasmid maintenance system antidote protein VapI